jgi:hypothetical protein
LKTQSVVNNVKTLLTHTPLLCVFTYVQENDMTDKRKISDQVLLLDKLEHLKIKTRLTNEKFASVKGECEI